jgi:hypothetical protein
MQAKDLIYAGPYLKLSKILLAININEIRISIMGLFK